MNQELITVFSGKIDLNKKEADVLEIEILEICSCSLLILLYIGNATRYCKHRESLRQQRLVID